ncbi:MAG: TonB-dependent receptor plug domain-containing protein [Tannerellaceae bacterium]|nr:TonB-dependent receptor plug domain-containing protein [Tannerellaceae bacterium]
MMLGCCLVTLPATAQNQDNRTIKGVVTSTTGEILPGATVTVEGTTQGVVTDIDGNFNISVPATTKSLVVNMVGMNPTLISLTSASEYRVVMNEEIYELGEVVAVGYGSVRRKDLSGAIANITEDKFNQGVVTSPEQLIKGQISGLVITKNGGNPNTESTMRLRGSTSLMGGNGPLVVIDGVPGASLSSVAPQDIESINVLKDASAAAIYGARSANGVIMITTKRGQAGKTSISYDGYFAVEKLGNNLDMLTADEWRDWVKTNNIENYIDYGGNTDWVNEIYRTGYSQNHNLSLMGGTENSTYQASVNFLDQKGIVYNNDLQRLNANIAFDQKALDGKLRVLMNANMTLDDYSQVPTDNVFAYALNSIQPFLYIRKMEVSWKFRVTKFTIR